MLPLRRNSTPRQYSLTPDQLGLIDCVTNSLPANLRHSFRLRVSSSLRLAADFAVSQELLDCAIDRALTEVSDMGESA